jgi:hypothetical protein
MIDSFGGRSSLRIHLYMVNCSVKLFRTWFVSPPQSEAGSPGRLPTPAPTDPDVPH